MTAHWDDAVCYSLDNMKSLLNGERMNTQGGHTDHNLNHGGGGGHRLTAWPRANLSHGGRCGGDKLGEVYCQLVSVRVGEGFWLRTGGDAFLVPVLVFGSFFLHPYL